MSTLPTRVDPSGVDCAKWREMLARFSEGELKDLCFDLGIDYENLPGQGKADKARELVAHCERRDRADELEAAYTKYLRQPLRRFASRHRYALISAAGTTIIALALVLSAVIFNVGPLRTLLPTPMAFRPAKGESLIIVADFEDRSDGKFKGMDPAQYIYEQLLARARQDQLDVRIERLRQVVDDNTVRHTGEVYSATLVLWGWYDALAITPRMERIKLRTEYTSTEEGQHLSLADPTKVEFSIVTDLPSQATYLTLFTLGIDADTLTNPENCRRRRKSSTSSILLN